MFFFQNLQICSWILCYNLILMVWTCYRNLCSISQNCSYYLYPVDIQNVLEFCHFELHCFFFSLVFTWKIITVCNAQAYLETWTLLYRWLPKRNRGLNKCNPKVIQFFFNVLAITMYPLKTGSNYLMVQISDVNWIFHSVCHSFCLI